MTDTTNRRGQDISAKTEIEKTQLQQAGELARLYATPRMVGKDQTLLVPNQTQAATGFGPTMMGIQERDPGKAYVMPDGTTAMGPAAALSVDQAKAAALERARAAGQVTDQQVVDVILDKTVQATDPATGKSVFAAPGRAVREGMSPVPSATQAPKTFVDANGVPVLQDQSGQFRYTDGRALPPDAKLFNTPTVTGSREQTGMGTTANQTEGNRVAANIATTRSLLDLYENTIKQNPGAIGIVGAIRGTAQNLIASGSDFARAFGNNAPQVQAAQEQLRSELQRLTGVNMFDPSIPEAEFIQHTLAYALARSEGGGSGDISNRDFQNSLDRVRGGGMLANSNSALAAIGAARKTLDAQGVRVDTLRNPGAPGAPAPAATAAPAAPAREERWERGPDGNLRRAQ
jgi:hypothetical protein